MVVISATIVVTVRPIMALTVSRLGLHDYTAVRAPVILNGVWWVVVVK